MFWWTSLSCLEGPLSNLVSLLDQNSSSRKQRTFPHIGFNVDHVVVVISNGRAIRSFQQELKNNCVTIYRSGMEVLSAGYFCHDKLIVGFGLVIC
jgi:hypothetical protein